MNPPLLREFLTALHAEVRAGLPVAGRVSATLGLTAVADAPEQCRLQVLNGAASASAVASQVTVEFEVGGSGNRTPVPVQPDAPAIPRPPADADGPSPGGDLALLRRRLAMVLGGPPGFTSGARAEVLADLLSEFGRPALLEILQREWVSHFDTGPDSSPAVTRVPLAPAGSEVDRDPAA